MPLELQYVAHQHLACRYCGTEFCALCPDAIAESVHAYQRLRRMAALASPN
jgi:PleD family two-component response regulator